MAGAHGSLRLSTFLRSCCDGADPDQAGARQGRRRHADDMLVDPATLRDLDVFSTSTSRGPTVWGLVNRTRTRAGRDHLRRLLVAANHSGDEILALQRAHQALAANMSNYQAIFERVDTDGVERYLNSNWQLPESRPVVTKFVESLWRPAWFRQYLQEVAKGQDYIVDLLRVAADLTQQLSVADATILRSLSVAFSLLVNEPNALELLRLGRRRIAPAQIAFDQLARDLAKPLLLEILDHIGAVEAMWSVGAATVEHGWHYPQPASRLRVVGLFHPFLGEKAVSNDLQLDPQTRVCFVTGPNMAGKSTFLKAVGIAALLAHAGCGVPAASMEFPVVNTIFSSVQIGDDLSSGESFYLAEVHRIRSLAEALHDHGSAIAVVDEPFRGTNVHDAAEATLAVVSRLLHHPSALIFVASHLAEIVPNFVDDPALRLLHFAADVSGEHPRFDYQLREGVSAQRLGMSLLKQERVLDLLERSVRQSTGHVSN
jgi:DNA mismatch repair protein MutS